MALVYWCQHVGLEFNGACDCVWERKRKRRHKLMRLMSWLPRKWLARFAGWEVGRHGVARFLDGEAFWMDAQYWQYCRIDQRRRIVQYAKLGFTPLSSETFEQFDQRVEESLYRPRSEAMA